MRNDNDKKTSLILSACGIVPVVWLALLTAPYVGGGIVEIIRGLTDAMGSPFAVTVCEDSVKTVLVFLAAYGMAIGIYFSTRRNYRRRELMTPDEVRMLDNRYALLFIRGERPVMDFKYDIMKHPNVKLTADGGQPPYIHGEPTQAVATLVFDSDIPQNAVRVNAVSTSYELLSDEDLEEIFNI